MTLKSTLSNYNFKKDKLLGDKAEDTILQILHESGFPNAYRVNGKEARWDIIIPEINKKLEIKNDVKAEKTGNLAIEIYKKNGNPSGIMISESDFWIIFAAKEIFMLDRVELKNYTSNGTHKITWGGDNFATQMALISIETIRTQDFCKKIG